MSEAKIAGTAPIYTDLEAGISYYWCTCGLSAKQPLCDGSHKGTDFKPMEFTADETKTRALCACKRTQNGPYCDGQHTEL